MSGDDAVTSETAEPAAGTATPSAAQSAENRYHTLPERVRPEDMVEEVPSEPARDPDFGRDPDRDGPLRSSS